MSTFPPVPKIQNGQNVNAETINPTIISLENRTDCNRQDLLNLILSNRQIFDKSQPVADSCLDSQVVYFDETTKKFTPAIIETTVFGNTQILLPGNKSFIVGIAKNITGVLGSRIGDIFTYGFITGINTANFFETSVTPVVGVPLHLTQQPGEEGRVTTTRNDKEVFVGILLDSTTLFLNPELRNLNDNHQHITVELDVTKWVDLGGPGPYLYPAAELPNFPPTPFENLLLYTTNIGIIHQTTNANNQLTVDADGITYEDTLSQGDPVNDTSEWVGARAIYAVISPGNEKGVNSLQSENEAIKLTDPITGDPTTNGDICLELNLGLNQIKTDAAGSIVLKNLGLNNSTGLIDITSGRVVEKIIAGAGITSSAEQGTITLSATQEGNIEQEITNIILQNAKQRLLPGENITPYIEFPNSVESRINGTFEIPSNASLNSLQIIGNFFGLEGDPNDIAFRFKFKVVLPGQSLSIPFSINNVTMKRETAQIASSHILANIAKENLAIGAFVSFQLIRDISDDYPAEVGLMNIKFKM